MMEEDYGESEDDDETDSEDESIEEQTEKQLKSAMKKKAVETQQEELGAKYKVVNVKKEGGAGEEIIKIQQKVQNKKREEPQGNCGRRKTQGETQAKKQSVSLLKTKVKERNAAFVQRRINEWPLLNNNNKDPRGRIWILWDPKAINLTMIETMDQVIHCRVEDMIARRSYLLSVVYARNNKKERE
ncbi:hypothetical protein FRX31_010814 [Thalictrum thalictroides]|uniref:Uncharacterized protein n=1 Tax=Thalictrum thalictroides TaxID=46969 RepID=A0A7J6WQF8_THATH|nr:hypothetical protein FRX31_010814 [Thalictrum thalictroides]